MHSGVLSPSHSHVINDQLLVQLGEAGTTGRGWQAEGREGVSYTPSTGLPTGEEVAGGALTVSYSCLLSQAPPCFVSS